MDNCIRSQTVIEERPAEGLLNLMLSVPQRPPLSERMGTSSGNFLDNSSRDESIFIARPVTPAKERNIAERIRQNRERAEQRQAELRQQEDEQDRIALQQVLATQAEIQRNVNIGNIIADICTLPLSEENQQQLEQWIRDFLANNNVQQQLSISAVLIFNFIRPLVARFPNALILAKIETQLSFWIAQRLPPGQNIEVFMRRCRQGLVNKASQNIALASLNDHGRELLRVRTYGVQQLAQASSRQTIEAMSHLQQQRRLQHTTATAIERLSERLQEEESQVRVHINDAETRGNQANMIRASLTEQLNRLRQEVTRL